ncbi:MAG: response regulator [Acidobacteriota bacterium]
MKILVVDDEDSVRELVKDAMVEQGYQVWSAASGREALDLGGEQTFDLVFCDVVMDGLTGFQVLEAFRGTLRSQAEIV